MSSGKGRSRLMPGGAHSQLQILGCRQVISDHAGLGAIGSALVAVPCGFVNSAHWLIRD